MIFISKFQTLVKRKDNSFRGVTLGCAIVEDNSFRGVTLGCAIVEDMQ